MKYMKLGTRPDTFHTQEATRTVISHAPTDLTITINNITYLLHKIPLVPKCGLLRRLCSDSGESDTSVVQLHDIPGGETAFELCAKYCYGITINLSAHNFVSAYCAAKFLRMTDTVEEGNFILKLEAFFNSCILQGWKDSIVTLQTTGDHLVPPEWSANLGIIRRCIDSLADKILTPPPKVTWSYTYTRSGYDRERHRAVPRDWWTEDVSDLDVDQFRCVIAAARSSNILPPQLIGEALHVYVFRWIHPDSTSTRTDNNRKRQILETIVGMIPAQIGSVSIGFLLTLLTIVNSLPGPVSPVTKQELLRRSAQQFEEATLNDLLLPTDDSHGYSYDIDLVGALLESFLSQRRRRSEERRSITSILKVGQLIDSYLQVVAEDVNMPVQKMVSLAATIPEIARPQHDQLYKAIDIYLKEHPDLTKEGKKQLCCILDCQNLSPEVRSHAVRNERLPLRTVVQLLFYDQERGSRGSGGGKSHKLSQEEQLLGRQQNIADDTVDLGKIKLDPSKPSNKAEGIGSTSEGIRPRLRKSDGKLQLELTSVNEQASGAVRHQGEERKCQKGKEIREEESGGRKQDHVKILQRKARSSQYSHSKGGER